MASYMFISDGGNNLFCNGILITDTNINLFTKDEFQQRFFADIMKDSQTDTAVSNIKDWLINCYKSNPNIPNRGYKNTLHDLENKVYSQKVVTDNITELKNILKTSTVGSNTKISLANKVFWESGFGSKDIIDVKDYTTYLTPASKLDPLSKEKADDYWPEDYTIGFDESFTGRLGFPNTVWVMPSPDKVQITYSNREVIEYDVTKDIDPVGKYLAGNNNKNDAINGLTKYSGCRDFIKYVETKELGDVAQVWNYLAFVAINAITKNGGDFKKMREESVMITTDSVVLLFCILLHLSCVYTGSREGVESGRCTLKHYLAGDVDYSLKLKTMIDNHYNRLVSQLAATNVGLLIMKRDKSKFWYYRYNRREQIAKTSGDFSFPKDDRDGKISQIDGLFQAVIENINFRLLEIEGIYNAADKNAVNDGQVDSKFEAFCDEIDKLKYPQLLTKLNTGSYVLHPQHPSKLLERYTFIIDPNIRIPNLDDVKDAAFSTDGITIQQGGGRDLVSIGGGNNNFTAADVDVEIHYYDFLLLTFIEHRYFNDFLQDDVNISVDDFFPVYYDHIVSQIDENTDLFILFGNYSDPVEDQGDEEHTASDDDDFDEEHAASDGDDFDEEHAAPDGDDFDDPLNDNIFQDFLDRHTDDFIIQRGRKLAKLMYFSPDIDEIFDDFREILGELDGKDMVSDDVFDVARRNEEHFSENETGDNTEDNTGMVVARAQGVFDETSFLSQKPTEKSSNTFPTPQTVTADLQGITYNPESVMMTKVGTSVSTDINNEGMEETGGRKPGRHKSKKNKHKISIKNKSKKNIKRKRTIKSKRTIKRKRTIKKKGTKRHKKTRKQN